MFEGIVASKGHCNHCGRLRLVAHIPPANDSEPYEVAYSEGVLELCAGCIAALQRLAYYLRRLEAEAPKKPRKRRKRDPQAIAPYQGPDKHAVGSLVPPEGDRSP